MLANFTVAYVKVTISRALDRMIKRKMHYIVIGIGSILDMMSVGDSVDLSRSLSHRSPAQGMTDTWWRVGDDLRAAMSMVDHEQTTSKTAE